MSAPSEQVVIAGAGVAGLSAAVRLAEAGVPVLVLETRRKLGGRASSFVDPRTGAEHDNCQHVALGCCLVYLDFLRRIGEADSIEWSREQYWFEAGGRESVVAPNGLPAPFHLSWSMARAKFLNAADVASIGMAGAAVLSANRHELDHITFAEFLRPFGPTARAVRRFWDPVVISACNLPVDRVSAAVALHVFQEGFMAHRDAAAIGVPTKPLSKLVASAQHVIEAAGGRVRFGASVGRVEPDRVTLKDGEAIGAEAVVCALPAWRAREVLAGEAWERDARRADLERFEPSAIMGIHLVYDRPVLRRPHAVLVDAETQWLFRKGEDGRHITAVISAADALCALREGAIIDLVTREVAERLPDTGGARVEHARVVKERHATFAPTPGLARFRPGATGRSGIVLAGDYTAVEWPSTMEGAARSGVHAAVAVADHLGYALADTATPSLEPALLPRLLGGSAPPAVVGPSVVR